MHKSIGSLVVALAFLGCAGSRACCPQGALSKAVIIYDHATISGNQGISKGEYLKVDGYRYANILVEFEQKTGTEEPISLGVVFAHERGEWGARRIFNLKATSGAFEKPTLLEASGKDSWHGDQWKKSSYIFRVPIMGPFLQVFPFNHHNGVRKFSVVLYLTD